MFAWSRLYVNSSMPINLITVMTQENYSFIFLINKININVLVHDLSTRTWRLTIGRFDWICSVPCELHCIQLRNKVKCSYRTVTYVRLCSYLLEYYFQIIQKSVLVKPFERLLPGLFPWDDPGVAIVNSLQLIDWTINPIWHRWYGGVAISGNDSLLGISTWISYLSRR